MVSAAYGTAKATLSQYTRGPALDLFRVNAITPGSTRTSALDVFAANDELRTPMEQVTPIRRFGDPSDIAFATVYLALPDVIYLTGKLWKSMLASPSRILTYPSRTGDPIMREPIMPIPVIQLCTGNVGRPCAEST